MCCNMYSNIHTKETNAEEWAHMLRENLQSSDSIITCFKIKIK